MFHTMAAAPAKAMIVGADVDCAFITAVLYAENISAKVPPVVQRMVDRLRKFTNVLPMPIYNQSAWSDCLNQADVVVNMLWNAHLRPVMDADADPAYEILLRAPKTTHMFNVVMPKDSAEAGSSEEWTDILCRKIETCLLEKAQHHAQDVQLLRLIS